MVTKIEQVLNEMEREINMLEIDFENAMEILHSRINWLRCNGSHKTE